MREDIVCVNAGKIFNACLIVRVGMIVVRRVREYVCVSVCLQIEILNIQKQIL